MSKRVPVTLGAVLLLAVGAVAGCGSDKANDKAEPSAAHSTSTPSGAPTEQTQTPKVKTPKVKDPLAPSKIKPVKRNGKAAHPTVSARPATMTGVVKYVDGVQLDITGISRGRVPGKGPGVVKGPTTSFSLSLKNGSRKALNLNSVVVTAVYADPGRIARPIYVRGSRDFAGTAKHGSTSTAVYTFGIPVTGRSRVIIHVDFDSTHTAAVFSGSAS